jgi:hypothetical protein
VGTVLPICCEGVSFEVIMGNFCNRRNSLSNHTFQETDNDHEWEVISIASDSTSALTAALQSSKLTFKKAVKLVIKLLFIRRLWASIGRWLSTRHSWNNENQRRVIANIWYVWKIKYIRRYCVVFNHLHRRNRTLTYREQRR